LGLREDTVRGVAADFILVASAAGHPLLPDELMVEFSAAPHARPRNLPAGKMAVYVFGIEERCLKVGKAGPKTAQRYTYQHYHAGSAPSTLSASILKHVDKGRAPFWGAAEPPWVKDVGSWIERHTWRANLLLPANRSLHLLNLLEAFVQCRLDPAFEGVLREVLP
jgi:hypothetical protein